MRLTLERRPTITGRDTLKIAIISMASGLGAFSIVLLQAGLNPLDSYHVFFDHAFTTPGIYTTIQRTTVLLFETLAIIIPLTAGIWNIGAEGQFFLGAIGATGISYVFSDMPSIVLIPIMILTAAACGGVWGGIPGYLKAKMNVNEILTTLFLNYIALLIVLYLTAGPWQTPYGRIESKPIPAAGRMPLIPGVRIPYTIFMAIGAAILLHFFLAKTRFGYKIRTVGHSLPAARFAGISFPKVASFTMIVGGALAGLAGFHQTSGVLGWLRYDISPGSWGYIAIVFALVANLHCLGAIIVSFILTGFLIGTEALYPRLGMSFGVMDIFVGLFFIAFAALQFLRNYKIKWIRGGS